MPKTSFEIRLSNQNVAIGEDLHGVVIIPYDVPQRCEGIRLRLLCRFTGKSDDDELIIAAEQMLLEHEQVSSNVEARFSLRIPHGPVSHKGSVVSVDWWIAARLLNDDTLITHDIRVLPGKTTVEETQKSRRFLYLHAMRIRLWDWLKSGFGAVALVVLGLSFIPLFSQPWDRWQTWQTILLIFITTTGFLSGTILLLVLVIRFEDIWTQAKNFYYRVRVGGIVHLKQPPTLGHPLEILLSPRKNTDEVRWYLWHYEWAGTRVVKKKGRNRMKSMEWTYDAICHDRGNLQHPSPQTLAIPFPNHAPSSFCSETRQLTWSLEVTFSRRGYEYTKMISFIVPPYEISKYSPPPP